MPKDAEEPKNPALGSYQSAQNALGSFYQQENGETKELRRELEQLKEELAQKDIPSPATVDDQLALMEKSYQMAAKYLPSGSNTSEPAVKNTSDAEVVQKKTFAAFIPAEKNRVSSLYRSVSDSTFMADWNPDNGFYKASGASQAHQQKNSIRACVHQTQTIIGQGFFPFSFGPAPFRENHSPRQCHGSARTDGRPS
ncbi:conjugative transposon protein TraM [Flavobacterium procerum]|uniref:conjugative transposon protein TraM n=1 Tax=Flavobacterium procerum TaxID=1455569 RepID=UPI0035EF491D